MGGINPPAPTDQLLTLTQEFTRAICYLNLHFWKGHSEIEQAVLVENEDIVLADSYINQAAQDFGHASHAAIEAQKACVASLAKLGKFENCDDELAPYFKSQLPRLIAVSGGTNDLKRMMTSKALRNNSAGTLQGGLFFDREHAAVRHNSLGLIVALSEIVSEHRRIVVCTNSVIDFAA